MKIGSTELRGISNVIQLKPGWLRIPKIGHGLARREEPSRADIFSVVAGSESAGTDGNVCFSANVMLRSWDRQECLSYLSFLQQAPQNLPGRALRDLTHKLNAPDALVRGYPSSDEVHDLLAHIVSGRLTLQNYKRFRYFARLFVCNGNDCCIGNRRMLEQQRFQFSRRHLPAVCLNQFLQSIYNEEPALVVAVTNISGAEPAIWIDHFRRRLGIAEIAFHYLWAAHPNLTIFIMGKFSASRIVNNPALGIRKAVTN